MYTESQTRAVVVGAGMPDLPAALVLSDHVDHVTVFERDELSDDTDATADIADSRTHGPRPTGTDLANAYFERAFRASHTSLPVARQLRRVPNLIARRQGLMTPTMVVRELWSDRGSPSAPRRADRIPSPRVPSTLRLEHYRFVP